jgi:hypothetical protein
MSRHRSSGVGAGWRQWRAVLVLSMLVVVDAATEAVVVQALAQGLARGMAGVVVKALRSRT